jgi:uncharacterized membrane protein
MSESSTAPTQPPAPSDGARDARPAWAVAGASLLGALFSAVSTSDFVTHLDRQVHSIHCSFVPGAGADLGENGCRTVMMSPYSSVLRSSMWGGLPISLLALAVFAYLAQRAVRLAWRADATRRDTGFLLLATGLPVAMSLVYGVIAATQVGALCKLCVGVYVASAAAFGAALWAHRGAPPAPEGAPSPFARGFLEGCVYVGIVAAAYVAFAPASAKPAEGCGTLVKSDDPNGVMVPLRSSAQGVPAIAVVDPLCPACRGFDARLHTSGLLDQLSLKAVLFPLDSACNWMVKESMHPGACTVAEAMLCDKDKAEEILNHAFTHQDELREEAKAGGDALKRRLEQAFPHVKGCLGTPAIRSKLNKSLRWAVANALPVLTPQLFVGNRRMCDEDTDLGLDYTAHRMVAAARGASGGK